jgi:hypothetical protein
MANVIDSLVVALGLDPSGFKKGSKEIIDTQSKTTEAVVKGGKSIEESSKKTADSISKVTREVLGLYAVFVGARGIKEFVGDLIGADAALGRFSRNLNTSPQTLYAWGAAAERVGGSSEQTAATFERIGKALYDLHRNGQALPKEYSQLQALTGLNIDRDHGVDKFLQDTATALQRLNQIDPSQVHFIAQGMGIDDATANVMIKYGNGIGAYIDQLKKLSPQNEAIKAAQDLQEKWVTLQQTALSLSQTVLEKLGPELAKLLTQMTDWITKNQDWLQSGIVKGVQDFASYLRSIDWKAVGQGLRDFGNDAKAVADALGGVVRATELLIGLWAGGKVLGMLGSLRTAAAGGAAAGGGASGLLGALGIYGAAAGGAWSLLEPGEGLKNAPRSKWGVDDLIRWALGTDGSKSAPSSSAPQNGMLGNGRDEALNSFLDGDTKIDGRPVSKSNPLPVTVQQQASEGGFWEKVGNFVGGLLGGGPANAATPPNSGSIGTTGSTNGNSGSSADWGKLYHGTGGSRSWRNNNPGNIEYGSYARSKGAIGTDGRFAVFPSYEAGRKAQGDLLFNSKGYRGLTLAQAINKWAPAGDNNNVPAYIAALVNGSGVSPDTRMEDIPPDMRDKILDAMQKHEGWRPGKQKAAGIQTASGASLSASLSQISNDNRVSTGNTSSHSVSIGTIQVNAPNATDAQGIADRATDALYRSTVAATANYGPR